jgi:hypothetical protein
MIYIGHFSFMKDNVCVEGLVDDNSYHGYFTTVVEAEKIEDALKKFRDLIFRLHSEEDMLDGVNEVFLDACVECKAIPDLGFLTHFVEWSGLAKGSVSTAIRGATDEQVSAYFSGSEASDWCEVEPFLLLDEVKP